MKRQEFLKNIIELILLCIFCLCAIATFCFGQNNNHTMHYEECIAEGYAVYLDGVKVDKPNKVGDLSKFDEIVFDEENSEIYIYSE